MGGSDHQREYSQADNQQQHTYQHRDVREEHQNVQPHPYQNGNGQQQAFYMNAANASQTQPMPQIIPMQFVQPTDQYVAPVTTVYYSDNNTGENEQRLLHMEAEYQNQLRNRLMSQRPVANSLETRPQDSLDGNDETRECENEGEERNGQGAGPEREGEWPAAVQPGDLAARPSYDDCTQPQHTCGRHHDVHVARHDAASQRHNHSPPQSSRSSRRHSHASIPGVIYRQIMVPNNNNNCLTEKQLANDGHRPPIQPHASHRGSVDRTHHEQQGETRAPEAQRAASPAPELTATQHCSTSLRKTAETNQAPLTQHCSTSLRKTAETNQAPLVNSASYEMTAVGASQSNDSSLLPGDHTVNDDDDTHRQKVRTTPRSDVDFVEINKRGNRNVNRQRSYGSIHSKKKEVGSTKDNKEAVKVTNGATEVTNGAAEDLWKRRARSLEQRVARDKPSTSSRAHGQHRLLAGQPASHGQPTPQYTHSQRSLKQRINVNLQLKMAGHSTENSTAVTASNTHQQPVVISNNNGEHESTPRNISLHHVNDSNTNEQVPHPTHHHTTNEDATSSISSPYKVLPPIRSADANHGRSEDHSLSHLVEGAVRDIASSDGYVAQFERNRKIPEYKQYTLTDYRRIKRDYKLGGLGPDLSNERLKEKRGNVLRKIQYAKSIHERNRHGMKLTNENFTRPRFSAIGSIENDNSISRHKIAMEYAKQVQKPILQVRGKDATPRSAALSAKSGPGKSSATRSDIAGRRDAAAAGHHDNAADRHDDAAASHHGDAAQLSAMQQRHEWERRKAAAISNTVHHPDDHATAGQ